MDHKELKAMVPSKAVREYIQKTGWTFTDAQKATLLAHNGLPIEERLAGLEALKYSTEDRSLKGQIEAYLARVQRQVKDDQDEEESFVRAFFPLPNPFERGDIVRKIRPDGLEGYGIVETSQQQVRESLERWKEKPELFEEFGDDAIRVAFLCDDGTFCHSHPLPLYLELYQPNWGPGDTEDSARDNLLLAASQIYRGKGSLDDLWYFTMEYRKARDRSEADESEGPQDE